MSDSGTKRSKLRSIVRTAIGVFVIMLFGIQLIPVDRSNPPVSQVVDATPEVMNILKRACFDCHSNEVVWPWYSKVAPVSWLIAKDVREGREHINFSTWDEYDAEDRAEILEEMWEEVEEGEMPLWFYTPLHPEAKLSEQDLSVLMAWTGGSVSSSDHDKVAHEDHDD